MTESGVRALCAGSTSARPELIESSCNTAVARRLHGGHGCTSARPELIESSASERLSFCSASKRSFPSTTYLRRLHTVTCRHIPSRSSPSTAYVSSRTQPLSHCLEASTTLPLLPNRCPAYARCSSASFLDSSCGGQVAVTWRPAGGCARRLHGG